MENKFICEKCNKQLTLQDSAFICSYECTFCENCTKTMNSICPNCSGELLLRPKRNAFSNNFHIFHLLAINANKEVIFDAISTPKGLNDWWTLKSSGIPKLNEVYNLNFTDEYNWYATISKLEKNKIIEFSIIDAKEEWLSTTFGFYLEEKNANVIHLHFYHKNWKSISIEFKTANYCWGQLLSQLKKYLETGEITPFEKRN